MGICPDNLYQKYGIYIKPERQRSYEHYGRVWNVFYVDKKREKLFVLRDSGDDNYDFYEIDNDDLSMVDFTYTVGFKTYKEAFHWILGCGNEGLPRIYNLSHDWMEYDLLKEIVYEDLVV